MRLLIIDPQGAALDLSWRAQNAGHKVKHFITQKEKTKHIGRGMVDVIEEFEPWARWADLVFLADNTRHLIQTDAMRDAGIPVIGPTRELSRWELERDEGMRVLRAHGIEVPASQEFNDYDKAIAYVKREQRRFVSKPSGDADKALSYCSESAADMVFMLERWKRLGKLKSPFILQEFIPGTEMAVGGWFGPGGFNRGWCEN